MREENTWLRPVSTTALPGECGAWSRPYHGGGCGQSSGQAKSLAFVGQVISEEKIAQPVGPQNLQGGSSSVPSQGLNWTGSVQGEIPWNPPETGCCWGKRWMENTKVTQRGRRWGPCPAKAGRGLSGCLLIYGSKKCHVRSKAQAPVQRSQIFSVKMQIVNILGIAGRIMSSLSFLFLLPHPPLPSFFSSSTYSFYPSKMQNCF